MYTIEPKPDEYYQYNNIVICNEVVFMNWLPLSLTMQIIFRQNQFPIQSIIKYRSNTYKDKIKITKKYTSYLCQWLLPNKTIYDKWLPQKDLFPWNNQNTINYHILLLTQYYTHKHNQHFTNILQLNFNEEQMRDSIYIPPPQVIPLCHIHINECNPDNDIARTQNTIQSQHGVSHIYDTAT